MPKFMHLKVALGIAAIGFVAALAGCAPAGAVIGDRVWRDSNRNGLQDPAEPGAAGVTVSLYREDGGLVASTSTDDVGAYDFAAPASGRYFLTFVALQDNRFTLQDAGDDEADSDADPTTGRTEVFDFDSAQSDLTWDAGLVEAEPTPTPLPPATPTYTPTPAVPGEGGTYEVELAFVLDEGACDAPAGFIDTVSIEIGADGTLTFTQPSTGDVNSGTIEADGSFMVSSERESYIGVLEFQRDESGRVTRVHVSGVNLYQDANGCTSEYLVEGGIDIGG